MLHISKNKWYLYGFLLMLWVVPACTSHYQNKGNEELGYRFEKDEIIFEFDIREYQLATTEGQAGYLEFSDFNIEKVVVAGDFNNWSKDGWKMRKVNEYVYQLHKPLEEFKGKMEWQYKFVVNEKYWIEPPSKASNRVDVLKGYQHSRNFLFSTPPEPSLVGNTTFKLRGYPNARRIVLAGSFNGWNEKQYYFGKEGEEWVCRIDLPEGRHTYKFIVDGHWIEDPENPLKELNEHHTFNSIIYKGEGLSVEFSLLGYQNAKEVFLVGSFNEWQVGLISLQKSDNGWITTMTLPKGRHSYKFWVDGKWIADPRNPIQEPDGHGAHNSVFVLN